MRTDPIQRGDCPAGTTEAAGREGVLHDGQAEGVRGELRAGDVNVTFDSDTHTYRINGVKVPSVTQVLKHLKKPFDSKRIAGFVAKKQGKTSEAVLLEWKQKSDMALIKGKALHAAVEYTLLEGREVKSESPEILSWLRFWNASKEFLQPRMVEEIIADGEYMIAGTVDAVLFSSKTKKEHVFDWKTGKFLTENPYRDMLLPPFDDLPECQYTSYSLQVSIYRLMLERKGREMGGSWLVHCDAEAKPYPALDLRERLDAWLKTFPGGEIDTTRP